jgi:putative membrane protein
MIVSKKINLSRILKGTGKHLVLDILTCTLTYYLYAYVIKAQFQLPSLVPAILGTALSFFIGFSNNQAYDRWWEARKIWGLLVNDSRSWARQVMYFSGLPLAYDANVSKDLKLSFIYRHIAFVFALKQKLRLSADAEYLTYLDVEDADRIKDKSNVANAILDLQADDLNDLYKKNIIDGFRFTELNKLQVKFCDEMGGAERIANTIFPVTYAFYTRIFIWIFIICITMVSADHVDHWAIIVGTMVGYIFLTTHKIGVGLLNPFENIPSGLALNQICRTIEIDMLQAMGQTDVPEPITNQGKEVVM